MDGLKSNLEWALMYQDILEKLGAAGGLTSYSTQGRTFSRSSMAEYRMAYEMYKAKHYADLYGNTRIADMGGIL